MCNIKEFCQIFSEKKIFKGCIKFAMFKLSLAIILPIMLVPLFEQTSITHTQALGLNATCF